MEWHLPHALTIWYKNKPQVKSNFDLKEQVCCVLELFIAFRMQIFLILSPLKKE